MAAAPQNMTRGQDPFHITSGFVHDHKDSKHDVPTSSVVPIPAAVQQQMDALRQKMYPEDDAASFNCCNCYNQQPDRWLPEQADAAAKKAADAASDVLQLENQISKKKAELAAAENIRNQMQLKQESALKQQSAQELKLESEILELRKQLTEIEKASHDTQLKEQELEAVVIEAEKGNSAIAKVLELQIEISKLRTARNEAESKPQSSLAVLELDNQILSKKIELAKAEQSKCKIWDGVLKAAADVDHSNESSAAIANIVGFEKEIFEAKEHLAKADKVTGEKIEAQILEMRKALYRAGQGLVEIWRQMLSKFKELKIQIVKTREELAKAEQFRAYQQRQQQAAPTVVNVTTTNIAPGPDPALAAKQMELMQAQIDEIEREKRAKEVERERLKNEAQKARFLEYSKRDKDGRNALHLAAIDGQAEVVRIYAEYKGLHEVKDAAAIGCCEGCCENTKDRAGNTPLILAAVHGHESVCQVLLDVGANATATNDMDRSALHMAVKHGHLKVVELLSARCPGILELKDADGNTAHGLAKRMGRQDLCDALTKAGAKAEEGVAEKKCCLIQ